MRCGRIFLCCFLGALFGGVGCGDGDVDWGEEAAVGWWF